MLGAPPERMLSDRERPCRLMDGGSTFGDSDESVEMEPSGEPERRGAGAGAPYRLTGVVRGVYCIDGRLLLGAIGVATNPGGSVLTSGGAIPGIGTGTVPGIALGMVPEMAPMEVYWPIEGEFGTVATIAGGGWLCDGIGIGPCLGESKLALSTMGDLSSLDEGGADWQQCISEAQQAHKNEGLQETRHG